MLNYLLLLAGLCALLVGGDLLVRGAVGIAERLKIPPLIIGLTIVAMGTSAPEMMVSIDAALNGSGGIAIGNVIGSNVANVLLVLAVPALIIPTVCAEEGIGRNMLVMVGLTIVFMGMLASGSIGRLDGLILLALLGLYLYEQLRSAQSHRNGQAVQAEYLDEIHSVPQSVKMIALLLVSGLVLLPIGAELTVNAATSIARNHGVSEEVIGLTVVALGTSLPELATSLLAVWRGNSSVALGNVIGSNIFNIGLIMGLTAVIAPVPVADRIIQVDMWVMFASALLVAALAHYCISIGKKLGGAMIAAYGVYAIASYIL
ncbi:MAG: calcium/sodium antiporter [Rhizobiaceae bacterium]